MIARLQVVLPFHLAVPEGKEFTLYSYDDNGYEVTVYPPVKTDHPVQGEIPDSVLIDEAPAVFFFDTMAVFVVPKHIEGFKYNLNYPFVNFFYYDLHAAE